MLPFPKLKDGQIYTISSYTGEGKSILMERYKEWAEAAGYSYYILWDPREHGPF